MSQIIWHCDVKGERAMSQRNVAIWMNKPTNGMSKMFSFGISLRWPTHIINPIDKTKLLRYTSHRRSTTVSLETYPSIHLFSN